MPNYFYFYFYFYLYAYIYIYLTLDNLLKIVESKSSRSFVQEGLLNTIQTASNQILN